MDRISAPTQTRFTGRSLRAALVLALILALFSPVQNALSFAEESAIVYVTTTQDELNRDGDCSLREAIQSINQQSPVDACRGGLDADIIQLGQGNYVLSIPGAREDLSATGDLDIDRSMTILGAGSDNTIVDGNGLDRVFHIVSTDSVVKIMNLTIQGGAVGEGEFYGGGGILNKAIDDDQQEGLDAYLEVTGVIFRENSSASTGGGIDNAGTAFLRNVTLHNNSAANGGGIFNDRTINLNKVTLYANTAENTGGGLDNNADATLVNVTLSGNQASAAGGGGLFSDVDITLLNSTIYNNSNGVTIDGGKARFRNTLVANSTTGENCSGLVLITSLGHNLDSDGTCDFNQPTDLSPVQPMLEPILDNGGNILTHALKPGSPAIDAGDNLDCPGTDARGAKRPADGNEDSLAVCDIGAYEYNGVFTSPILLPLLTR